MRGSNPQPTGGETKKFKQQPGVRIQDLQSDWATRIEVTKCINGVEIKWSFGRISKKKRITDHDFPPPFLWAENNIHFDEDNSISKLLRYSLFILHWEQWVRGRIYSFPKFIANFNYIKIDLWQNVYNDQMAAFPNQ